MRETEALVSFRPSSKEVYVLRCTRLVEAAAGAGIVLELPCGGEGICGKCRVKVAQGAAEPTAEKRRPVLASFITPPTFCASAPGREPQNR